MGRYWSVAPKDMRAIQGGYIKYIIRKNRNTNRWELTIRRKMVDGVGMSDTIIQSPSWESVRMYVIDHWSGLKGDGYV